MLDSIFLPDSPGVAEFRSEYLSGVGFDPLQLLSSVATATEQVGLIATTSTTYSYSWDVARRLATLDFLSHGRAGWNIVTTAEPAAAARAEYAGRTSREHIGPPRPARSVAPPRVGDSTTQGGERPKATTAASPAGDLR